MNSRLIKLLPVAAALAIGASALFASVRRRAANGRRF